MKKIQAKKHKIEIYEIDNISLSCFDDKRHVLDDGVKLISIKIVKSVITAKIIIIIIMIIIIKINDNDQ